MKHFVQITLLLMFVALFVWGCGSSTTTMSGSANKQTLEDIPDWYLNQPDDPDFIFTTGSARSRELQLARDKAGDAARMEMAKALETRFQGMSKRFQEEVGTDADAQYLDQFTQATKAVVSTTLTGVSVEKSKITLEDGMYRAFVLLKLPIGASNDALLNKLKQQEQLYTRFRSSQVFEEMNQEMEKYDEWKKDNR
ncbi:hypothetical protein K8I28_16535 [bacterium]|nr:hypothetical protein [bacterium]